MDRIKIAVKAGIPLISVSTDDPINAVLVLSSIIGTQAHKFPGTKDAGGKEGPSASLLKEGHTYVLLKSLHPDDYMKLYEAASDTKCVVVAVNPDHKSPAFFDAGIMTCPPDLTRKFVKEYSDAEDDPVEFEGIVAALSGLSYKSMVELTMLAVAEHDHFSARSTSSMRRALFSDIRGLRQEKTDTMFYKPNKGIAQWVLTESPLFRQSKHPELRPRGILLDGPPGTGKTEGARYVAREMNLPLYRLDVAGSLNKYIGESEKAVKEALAQADQCGPCVLLVDEVEKLFSVGHSDNTGTGTRMLSSILWWLQEHTSQVLTVMTTNKVGAIPPELVRPGRIDQVMTFNLLDADDGLEFMQAQRDVGKKFATVSDPLIKALHKELYSKSTTHSHAALNKAVMDLVKATYLSETH